MATTVLAGASATVALDAWASVTLVVDGQARLVFTSGAPNLVSSFSVTKAQSRTYGPYGVPTSVVISAIDRPLTYVVNGQIGGLAYLDGVVVGITGQSNQAWAVSEVSAYVNMTATGTAFSGACEYAGYICTVAAGNITIYDNTAASGTVIVPATALATGSFPIFGSGTNGKMYLATGCHVVLSGAATVNILVQ